MTNSKASKAKRAMNAAWRQALTEGRVVIMNDGSGGRSFNTVAEAEAYLAKLTSAEQGARIATPANA